MGQQQLLLIILGVIVVGIAIAVGISQFSAHSTQANKDGVTSSLVNISANAYQFRIRPTTMGGGGGTYNNYTIPSKMASDNNGTYAVTSASGNTAKFTGTSAMNGAWTAVCSCDSLGNTSLVFTGW
ncbi:MAG TPA: hypothetical protein VLY03_03105 [Bacteroidota bacterium]|nr:hypothetical protein [Bacteroidota bacterium]